MTDMAELPSEPTGWLSDRELAHVRSELPLLYVNAIPVRINPRGEVAEVGLLLRADEGVISRALVAGRVLLPRDGARCPDPQPREGPRPRGVAARAHLANAVRDRGVLPDARESRRITIPRQHAVALAYVVPVDGDCEPCQNALDIVWLTPEEAASPDVAGEMSHGQDVLLRQGWPCGATAAMSAVGDVADCPSASVRRDVSQRSPRAALAP